MTSVPCVERPGSSWGPRPLSSRWILVLAGVTIFAVAWLSGGYQVYVDHQGIQLPLVEYAADQSLFPRDAFVATLSRYVAPVWLLIGEAAESVRLELLLLLAFVVEKACLLISGAVLASALRPRSRLAPWAGALVLAIGVIPLLGGGTVTKTYFEQTAAAVPFFLLAFAAIVRGRRWHWPIFYAIGATLNPMYGAYALVYCVVGILALHRRRIREWAAPTLLLVALSAPIFGYAAWAHAAETADPSVWLAAVHARFPYHLFPLDDGFLLGGFALLLAATLVRTRQSLAEHAAADRFVVVSGLCAAAWVIFALAAAYVIRSPGLLVMSPARATDLWYGTAGVFLAAQCAAELETARGGARAAAGLALAAALMLQRIPAGTVVAGSAVLLILAPRVWARLGERPLLRYAAVGLLLLTAGFGARRASAKYAADREVGHQETEAMKGVREVSAWASVWTPKEAVFIVPPDMGMFRALSRRNVVGTWQDGGAMLWDRPFAGEWVRRMRALGKRVASNTGDRWPLAPTPFPRRWSDQEVLRIGQEFGARYCVLPTSHRTRLPVVFRGQHGLKVVLLSWETEDREAKVESDWHSVNLAATARLAGCGSSPFPSVRPLPAEREHGAGGRWPFTRG